VAVLDRARPRRKFRRLTGAALGHALGESDTGADADAGDGDEASSPPTALAGGSHEPPGPAATDSEDADPA
jgi:proteasome alpha subunit